MLTVNWYNTKSGKKVYVNHDGPFKKIQEVVSDFNPEVVIELGTGLAGFTFVIKDCVKDSIPIYSFDVIIPWSNVGRFDYDGRLKIKKEDIVENCIELDKRNVKFYMTNVLGKVNFLVEGFMRTSKKIFLWLDNGNKLQEFNLYSPLLKSGDMIGIHDWGKEIFLGQIKDKLEDYIHHSINRELGTQYCSRFFIKK
jgi:cephalosporin hydroxylase